MSVQIHPTAIVAKEAEIGDNVKIGPYCIVDPKTKIGPGTELRAFARVCDYTVLGAGCTIYEHAVIGGVPQDLSYRGEETWAVLGDRVVCREFVTVNRAVGEGNVTKVGDGCFVMEGVHFAHNVQIGRECTIANKAGLSGHVVVGDYVVIGGMTGFHQFTHIGSYCMIGGLSRITQDVPPYCLAAGVPLRVFDINKVGLRRRNIDLQVRRKIRDMYKLIYNSGLSMREALEQLAKKYPNDTEAKMILDFATSSTRGFTPRVTHDWNRKQEEKLD